MPIHIDGVIQEGNSMSGIMDKYSARLEEAGFGEAERNAFKFAIADTLAKDTAQKNAVELVRQKTAAQSDAMDAGRGHIRASQNAARAAYGEDNKAILREFHAESGIKLNTVKKTTTELEYMKGVSIKHQSDLAKNGFSADDIASFDTLSLNLTNADTGQENAKKAQVTATAVRDKSAKALDKLIKKVRNIAKVKFKNDEDILKEFGSITVRRGGGGGKEEPPPQEPPKQ